MRAKLLMMAGAVALAVPTLTLPLDTADAATRELRYADFGPNRGTRAAALKWLDTELRKRSNNELGLKFTWGGALLNAKTSAKGLGAGVADMASIVAVYNPGTLVVYEAPDALMLSSEWAGMRATYELLTTHPKARAEFKKKNIRYFSNFTTGPTQLLSRMPIKSIEDLKGKKLRATGGFVKAFNAAGATTVSVPQPKVYEALSSKTVDGTTNYWYVIRGYKQYEVASHITELNLGQVLGFGIAMNERTYQSLSAKHKAIVDKLGSDFIDYMAARMIESRSAVKAELVKGVGKHKVTVYKPGPGMREMLAKEAAKDVEKWLGKAKKKGLDGPKVLATFKGLYDKYEAEAKAKGYPWKR